MIYLIVGLFSVLPREFFTEAGGDNMNLALNSAAEQSSTYDNVEYGIFYFGADLAVDGNTDGDLGTGSCTHTDLENQPWWQVDLGDTYTIHAVEITNRNDFSQRLNHFNITTSVLRQGSGELANTRLCFYQPNVQTIDTVNYTCESFVLGRFVRIQLQEVGYLTLCEVRIFGYSKERLSVFSVREKRKPQWNNIVTSYETRRYAECLTECTSIYGCTSVSVGWLQERRIFYCVLLQDLSVTDAENEVFDEHWTYYVL